MSRTSAQLQALIATRQVSIDDLISYSKSLFVIMSIAGSRNNSKNFTQLTKTKRLLAQRRHILERLREELEVVLMAEADDV